MMIQFINPNIKLFILVYLLGSFIEDILLFMKYKIDELGLESDILQNILLWSKEKTESLSESLKAEGYHNLSAIRAFYCHIDPQLSQNLHTNNFYQIICVLDPKLEDALSSLEDLPYELAFDRSLCRILQLAEKNDLEIIETMFTSSLMSEKLIMKELLRIHFRLLASKIVFTPQLAGILCLVYFIDLEFINLLGKLKNELPEPRRGRENRDWWQEERGIWIKKLREILILYRNIGHKRILDQNHIDLIQQYLKANILLLDCLKKYDLSLDVIQSIENNILCPISCIKDYIPLMI
jgi:hypothetical protein